ncbi:hypothetical protein [Streptomyces niveus]|uniref:Sel1 repeat family protein n=1 Tax=Streptomyces niveus TaxID=193462 RepID=A0ABZ2AG68_STRNV|nr:hypothetical protein [Streptomyces niveus]
MSSQDLDRAALLEATQWYSKASDAGDQVGPLHLGQLYEDQYKDAHQAVYWYDLAARRGNGAAQERLTGLRQRIRLGIDTSREPEDVRSEEEPEPARRAPAAPTLSGLAAEALRQRWLADWEGSAPLATAQCLDVLVDTCGGPHGEWATLDDTERERVLADFLAVLPPRANFARAARDYYEASGPGRLRDHAAGLLRAAEWPEP